MGETRTTALEFRRVDGVWNPRTKAVHFFGDDAGRSVMFTVPRETLAMLARAELISEREILRTFFKHLMQIRDAAKRAYETEGAAEPGPAYVLKSTHFA